MEQAPDLFASDPDIKLVDVIASKGDCLDSYELDSLTRRARTTNR